MDAPQPPAGDARGSTVRDGVRLALPLVLPTALTALSFGVAARAQGWGVLAPVLMSVLVFSGSAQFASTGVLAAGGGLWSAVGAATLANLRFLPLGLVTASATRGGPVRRAVEGQLTVDASVVLAADAEGRVSRPLLIGSTAAQAVGWVSGTAVGAAADLGADAGRFGIDVVFPAFFLTLLVTELRDRRSARVALVGAALALVLIPLVPPGVPVVAATAAALLRLRR